MPAVALYARVSTADKAQDPETQLRPLRDFVARHGWPQAKEYVEKESAVKTRPIFNQLLKDAHLRLFDIIVVWKLDRFARSMQEFITTVGMLDSYGVRFVDITNGIDTDKQNAANRMMMHMLAALAEFEHSLISERVKAGIARSRASGKVPGRAKKVFDIERAARRQAEGWSFAKIAKEQGVSTATAFSRMARALETKEIEL